MTAPTATDIPADVPRVLYQKRGHVAHVTLNRPEVLNALDMRMHEELAAVWDDFADDDSMWLAVLTGSGQRAFSVGQDLKELVARTADGTGGRSTFGSRGKPGWPRLTERFELTKPIIAKVRGYAYGGGFELALACDLIVAAEDAMFALPEAKLGLIAGAGGVFRLTRQIPYRIAMGYLLTGRAMTAATAAQLGLVNEVVPSALLDECVDRWAQDILRCAPLAVRAAKEAASASATLSLSQAFAARYTEEERRSLSQDAREGPLAFVEKRSPQWSGR